VRKYVASVGIFHAGTGAYEARQLCLLATTDAEAYAGAKRAVQRCGSLRHATVIVQYVVPI